MTKEEKLRKQNYRKGIICILLAAFFFACMNLFIRLAGDINFVEKSFFRNLVAAIFAFILLRKKKIKFDMKGEKLGVLARCFFGTMGVFCNFYAVDHLNISDASLLNKLSPFFAIICSYFVLKETIKPYQLGCVILAFIGAVCVLKPFGEAIELFPALIGLSSGLFAGVAYTFLRKSTSRGVAGPVVVLAFSIFSCVAALPYSVVNFDKPSLYQLAMMLLCGLSAAGGQFAITAAYTKAPASEIAVYDYAKIPFAALLGFLFLSQMPDKWSFVGYIIIFVASLLKTLIGRKH